jgi:hypothetical protein
MESVAPTPRSPLVRVERADPDALPVGEPGGCPGTGDELAARRADVLRSTGTAAALAHRLGAHAALLAD